MANDLNELLELIPTDKRGIARGILDELEFIQETLTKLKQQIRDHGVIEDFKQGKQQFTRESPALKSYNMTIARYATLNKQLLDLLPHDAAPVFEDALTEFIDGD